MNSRVDAEATALGIPGELLAPANVTALAAVDPDDRPGGHALPRDHPAWLRDTLSLSQRAHALIVRFKPIILHVVAAWEHRVRSIAVGGRRMSVDASGSYRLD